MIPTPKKWEMNMPEIYNRQFVHFHFSVLFYDSGADKLFVYFQIGINQNYS